MPYIWPRPGPVMPAQEVISRSATPTDSRPSNSPQTPDSLRARNRRLRYLLLNPGYFNASLELADPLLYDRLIRRFQTPAEREAEGRQKGYSGTMEADLWRAEAKMQALRNPDPHSIIQYTRGPHGEIFAEEEDEIPESKEEGWRRWKDEMQMRFLQGKDDDFEYKTVDESEEYDDRAEEDRESIDEYLRDEEGFEVPEGQGLTGETGIQDF